MYGYNEHNVNVINDNIKNSLKKCGIMANVSLKNGNKVVSAYNNYDESHPEYLYLWVRMLPYKDTGKYLVDISNIILPDSKRGCGTFYIIYNRLRNCKYVENVTVTNPCTDSMYHWLKKHNLVEIRSGVWM